MRIAILATGSRGAVRPLLAVGDELRQRGHSVVLSVDDGLAAWASHSGLEICVQPQAAPAEAARTAGPVRSRAGDSSIPEAGRFWWACADADVILSSSRTVYYGNSLAERAGVPHLVLELAPGVPTGDFASLHGSVGSLGLAPLNRASHKFYLERQWREVRESIAQLRCALGLTPLQRRPRVERLATIGLYSSLLVPRPRDWARHQPIVGFVTPPLELRSRLGEAALPDGLERWLDEDGAPVFVDLSPLAQAAAEALLERVIDVTRQAGVRALIGAGDLALAGSSEHVFIADRFDHERVLLRCLAALHHGAAGTTGTVLRAGVPALVASGRTASEGAFWGWRVQQLGAGIHSRSAELSAEQLKRALEELTSRRAQARASQLGLLLRAESGAVRAANLIESWTTRTQTRPATPLERAFIDQRRVSEVEITRPSMC